MRLCKRSIICEGQTEEMCIKRLLAPEFIDNHNIILTPIIIGKPGHKGGNIKYARFLPDIKKLLMNDIQSFCTTFFDFYGLDLLHNLIKY